ncbi:SDR family NAD(P)-dependent oxidoreductase [Phenylobacterium sp.]|uniref:SDR family NAD(P)-dependent oxidoreductase n=1 Tax=Phenylobacterium sp. TaxID=1871053 RepID=UPI002737D6B9|nr:SDR family NAD(P)-dependent oxidoreductase [Phenylobacterium sp.]MDP3867548.1 SDR family NAD(P)-dependent oxidoreductase [Phenylobacterium sp.]
MGDFQGRTGLVTGAAGGMGAAAVRAFALRGARVVALDRRAEDLESLCRGWRAEGFEVEPVGYDQGDPESIERAFQTIDAARGGTLDFCFANAGYGRYRAAMEVDAREWKRHMDINLTGTFLVVQAAARRMIAEGRGGAVVMNASSGAVFPTDMLSAYCASKAGLVMLVKILASELGAHRIRVNAVLPGVIDTPMTESLMAVEGVRETLTAATPLGRAGLPDDVAQAAAFLCSDAASYVTGTTLLIDGGQTLHGYPRWFSTDHRDAAAPWTPHVERTS